MRSSTSTIASTEYKSEISDSNQSSERSKIIELIKDSNAILSRMETGIRCMVEAITLLSQGFQQMKKVNHLIFEQLSKEPEHQIAKEPSKNELGHASRTNQSGSRMSKRRRSMLVSDIQPYVNESFEPDNANLNLSQAKKQSTGGIIVDSTALNNSQNQGAMKKDFSHKRSNTDIPKEVKQPDYLPNFDRQFSFRNFRNNPDTKTQKAMTVRTQKPTIKDIIQRSNKLTTKVKDLLNDK